MENLLNQKFEQGSFQVYPDKPSIDLIHIHQKHTSIVVEFQGEDLSSIEADGIVSEIETLQGKALAIKTADCLPVLFLGEKVALIHAGWRGLADKILTHALLKKEHWQTIYIGPSIRAYEVQSDFKQHFADSSFFSQQHGKLYFDLQKEAINQLKLAYPSADIRDSDICTYANSRYNSYRRDKTKLRNWNLFIKE